MEDKKRIIVIDSSILIHRAYHALPPLKNKKGELVNAVYGFFLIFFKAIKEFQPNYIAAIFDMPSPTFRHLAFKDYKTTRPPTPANLTSQIPKIKTVLKKFGIAVFGKKGFEADDLIGTVSRLALNENNNNLEVFILSCDLDTLQLVGKSVKVYALRKGFSDMILYDKQAIAERFRLAPENLVDYRALKGDPSDNIPGVAGIGEKTAISLLRDFGSLDNLYRELKESTLKAQKIPVATKKKLIENEDKAWLSRDLSVIKQDVPINFHLRDCGFNHYDREKAAEVFEGLGFRSLISKLP
ncbi:MAG: DNA polymerase I, DNA polymerase I [Parcubacteria group bacterium GW2011_GWC1_38_6]|nr:MAG: polymerase protein [Parcubacteria group bacterium GW2011_GWA1_36_12]KKQ76862.1 MAG: DNA polymerase I, DNA polymerase I [Parcubacteria group bacterium GW2011_GWC1_38_6]